MQANETLKEMVKARGLSTRAASVKIGRHQSYVSRMTSKGVSIGTGILAEIGDALGYDLIIRDRESGKEWRIDPPEK